MSTAWASMAQLLPWPRLLREKARARGVGWSEARAGGGAPVPSARGARSPWPSTPGEAGLHF